MRMLIVSPLSLHNPAVSEAALAKAQEIHKHLHTRHDVKLITQREEDWRDQMQMDELVNLATSTPDIRRHWKSLLKSYHDHQAEKLVFNFLGCRQVAVELAAVASIAAFTWNGTVLVMDETSNPHRELIDEMIETAKMPPQVYGSLDALLARVGNGNGHHH